MRRAGRWEGAGKARTWKNQGVRVLREAQTRAPRAVGWGRPRSPEANCRLRASWGCRASPCLCHLPVVVSATPRSTGPASASAAVGPCGGWWVCAASHGSHRPRARSDAGKGTRARAGRRHWEGRSPLPSWTTRSVCGSAAHPFLEWGVGTENQTQLRSANGNQREIQPSVSCNVHGQTGRKGCRPHVRAGGLALRGQKSPLCQAAC